MSDDRKTPEREEVVKLFKRGLRFSEELLAENERLRLELAQSSGGETLTLLRARVKELEEERDALLKKFEHIDATKNDYQERFDDIESEHSQLANLYIAGIQLHAALDLREVLNTMTEIVLNLVGAERFYILLRSNAEEHFVPVVSEGQALEERKEIVLNEGALGERLAAAKVQVSEGEKDIPMVVVPLVAEGSVCAAIIIETMLSQKSSLSAVDHELFRLLATQGAISIKNGVLRGREGAETGISEAEIRQLLSS